MSTLLPQRGQNTWREQRGCLCRRRYQRGRPQLHHTLLEACEGLISFVSIIIHLPRTKISTPGGKLKSYSDIIEKDG